MYLFILLHGVLVVVLAVAMWGLSSQIRDGTSVSCIAGGFLTTGPPGKSQRQCSLAQDFYFFNLNLFILIRAQVF